MPNLKEAEQAMKAAVEATRREFSTVRTGKATPALLDTVRVEAYGGADAPEPGGHGQHTRADPPGGATLRPVPHRSHREGHSGGGSGTESRPTTAT